jgi:hypothetical protein
VEEQMFLTIDSLALHFNTIPRPLLASLMEEMVQQKEFRLSLDGEREGRLIYKNGFYVFQPDRIKDTRIPIAIRVAKIPILRDEYVPKHIEEVVKEEDKVSRLIGEKAAKKVATGNEDSEALWEQVLEWVDAIRNGTAESSPPTELLTEVSQLRESIGIYKAQKERIVCNTRLTLLKKWQKITLLKTKKILTLKTFPL